MSLNISSHGSWPANVLSNFAATPFVFDDVECASAEGLVQALKFVDPAMQRELCKLIGLQAKACGRKATKQIIREQKVWWQWQSFKLRSPEHFMLVERGLRAKFTQNGHARRALLFTQGMALTHNLGHESPHTSLPAREFIGMLTRIRTNLLES